VTPLPPGAVREVVAPGLTAVVTAGGATILIPADALAQPGTLQVWVVATPDLPPVPDNASFTLQGQAVEIMLFDQNGQPVANPTFTNPIQVCLAFLPDALAQAGSESLVVRLYNTAAAAWMSLPTTVDAAAGRACGATMHLSLFGLTAERTQGGVVAVSDASQAAASQAAAPQAAEPAALPATSGPESMTPPWWLLVTVAVVGVGGLLLRRRRPRSS
jgi:hypothetical protein